MRPRLLLIASCLALVAGSPALAQIGGLSLRDALAEALRTNPELVALRQQADAVRAGIPESHFLDPPMLQTQIWGWPVTTLNPARTDMYMFMAEQQLPGRGKRDARALVAARDADLSRRQIDVRANAILDDVKQVYADLMLARATTELFRDQKRVLENMADTATLRYASGASGQHDTAQSIAELARIDAEIVSARERARLAETRLNTLLGRDPGAAVPALSALDPAVPAEADAEQIALQRHPGIAMADAEIAREEAELARLRGERKPDFTIGGGYMLQPGEAGAWTATAGITWPNAPWSRGKLNTRIDVQEKRLAAARAARAVAVASVRQSVQEAITRLDAARTRVHLLDSSVLPHVEHAFETARVSYATSRGEFASLLDTERLLLSTRMDLVTAQADQARAVADLQMAIGDIPEN
jgi:cobalt-zinc-cadmium efflux system outer membrane protein